MERLGQEGWSQRLSNLIRLPRGAETRGGGGGIYPVADLENFGGGGF